jgi:nucleotide-binding universal stress UspA family protein
MATTTPQTIKPQPKISRRAHDRLPETAKRGPHRVLVVVDGSERTGRVVEQAKALASDEKSVQAILLNVQPAPVDGRLRGYGSFKREEIRERLVDCLGRRAVTAAGRVLSHAGIENTFRVEIGNTVATILRIANEEGCDAILIGSAAPSTLQKWLQRTTGILLATVATQVAQLSEVPVIVVK